MPAAHVTRGGEDHWEWKILELVPRENKKGTETENQIGGGFYSEGEGLYLVLGAVKFR